MARGGRSSERPPALLPLRGVVLGCSRKCDLQPVGTIPVHKLGHRRAALRSAEDLYIRTIEQVLAGKDLVQPLHRHDHYFLLAVTAGRGVQECDLAPQVVAPRTIYFMRPGQVHRLELKAGTTGFILQFKADLYAPADARARLLLRRAGTIGCFRPDPPRYAELVVVLSRILQEREQKADGFIEVVRAYLGVLFAELVLRASRTTRQGPAANTYAQERLEELLELIERHAHTIKQVSRYAEMMHLSTFQLNAIAKAGSGRTCSELINGQVILEAKRLLLATSDQVGQVADHLGYVDVSYFIRFFKRHTGHTPEAFRQLPR